MVFYLIWFLSVLALGLLIAGVNAKNMCDLSIIVYTFRDIPVTLGLLVAFLLGAIWTLPFYVKKKRKKKKKLLKNAESEPGDFSPEETGV
ncbi:MAG: hypothetical protein JW760_03985 [Spirochaetales bacterium]|nr:hypothetical protein [Spirochaetales bacterium]